MWIPGKIEEILINDAAIVPLSNEDLKYGEGGTYTTEDRKLYCYSELKKGTKIKHKDKEYTIQESKDYADFDNNLRIYIVRRGGND